MQVVGDVDTTLPGILDELGIHHPEEGDEYSKSS